MKQFQEVLVQQIKQVSAVKIRFVIYDTVIRKKIKYRFLYDSLLSIKDHIFELSFSSIKDGK